MIEAPRELLREEFGTQLVELAQRERRFHRNPRHASWMYQEYGFEEWTMHQLLAFSLKSRISDLEDMGEGNFAAERLSMGLVQAENEDL
jgi:hypothetical protein